jgi:hypothetical protein
MADVLRLANVDQSETINLLSGTLKLADKSWVTSSARQIGTYSYSTYGAVWDFDNYDPVLETMELVGDDTTANLRTALNTITEALEESRIFHQHPRRSVTSITSGPVSWWLEWSIDGESTKRALIYEGSLDVLQGCGHSPFMQQDAVLVRLSLLRHPLWEEISYSQDQQLGISCWVGKDTYTNIAGETPARLSYLQLSGKGPGGVYRAWMGFREKLAGMTNFEPLWECEDGSTANGSSVAGVSGSSGGNAIRVVGPASSLTKYWSMTVDDVCTANSHSDYAHQMGEYLVLLRCKVNNGTVGLQLQAGYDDNAAMVPSEEIYISHTSYQVVELGEVKIPPIVDEVLPSAGYIANFELQIYAEQVSGTSTLDLDAIALVPNQHFAYLDKALIKTIGINFASALVFTRPDGEQGAFGEVTDATLSSLDYSFRDWNLPVGDSVFVIVGTAESSHSLTETVDLTYRYYPRYLLYR